MKPEEIGRRFGIGVRVAGRIAKDGAKERVKQATSQSSSASGANSPAAAPAWSAQSPRNTQSTRSASVNQGGRIAGQGGRIAGQGGRIAGQTARAAGRGVAGFLKPFTRVGGILWLEVTGFFFGLFAVFFASTVWRTHTDYAQGPHHQQFLIAAVLTAVFTYLSVSSFLRTRKR